ncbi:MAG: glycosyltransferase [Bacillota bacterium]
MKVLAIVPAFNEERTVSDTVSALLDTGVVDDVVVVDDGSRDTTRERAEMSGAQVVSTGRNRGKGGAINLALKQQVADLYVFVDADIGRQASEVTKLVEAAANGADMAIARIATQEGSGGLGIARRLCALAIWKLCGFSAKCPLSGIRAVRREVIERVGRLADGFGMELALTVDAVRGGFSVVEVDTDIVHKGTGRDAAGFVHRARQLFHAMRAAWARII